MTVEFQSLKIGEVLLRERWDRRIRKCNGCKRSIADIELEPPTDICLVKKEKIPKMGKSYSSQNPDDFVLAKVHYHPSSSCLKFDFKKLKISADIKTLEPYIGFLKINGILQ